MSKLTEKLQNKLSNSLVIAGLDEVGRGPWAGPIVACAYIEVGSLKDVKIADSKVLNQSQREKAYHALIRRGLYGIGEASPEEIDQLGLAKANRLAFNRAISALPLKPDLILIDGKDKITLATTNDIPFKTYIRGDSLIRSISCASIIAKVTRDRLMIKMSKKFPNFHFEKHKGYGTLLHRQAIKKHGISAIHRKSYKPIQQAITLSALPA
ncbi:MAG: ribonuclease HII [Candidatus Altimarinota bacterium]